MLAIMTRFMAASNASSSTRVIGRVFEDELRRGFGLDVAGNIIQDHLNVISIKRWDRLTRCGIAGGLNC